MVIVALVRLQGEDMVVYREDQVSYQLSVDTPPQFERPVAGCTSWIGTLRRLQ